jgi:hypothetical protein
MRSALPLGYPAGKKIGRYPAFSSTDKQNLDLNVNCSMNFLGVFLAGVQDGDDVDPVGQDAIDDDVIGMGDDLARTLRATGLETIREFAGNKNALVQLAIQPFGGSFIIEGYVVEYVI